LCDGAASGDAGPGAADIRGGARLRAQHHEAGQDLYDVTARVLTGMRDVLKEVKLCRNIH